MRINNNVMAFNAFRNLSNTQNTMGKSLEKLSSGYRINRAGDDAAGLVISENLRAQVGGLKVAVRNAQDGISVVQTAEGALTEVHSMLQRIRDLAVQASNGSNNAEAIAAAQAEVDELGLAIQDIAERTQFNGKALLDGPTGTLSFQVGANNGETLDVALDDMTAATLGVASTTLTLAEGDTNDVIGTLDTALSTVSTFRGKLGAAQNRLEHTISNLQVATENLQASESRIRDTDLAQEMVTHTRNQIMQQAGTAMLAQANQVPQSVRSLLR